MERVYFTKASKEELKFASEAIEILTTQKVKLNMVLFFGKTKDLSLDDVNVCNTSCCIAGAHAIHFNKHLYADRSYLGYIEKVGIDKNGYFEKFVLSELWPANDVEHAIRRLKIVADSGFIPCISVVDLMSTTLDGYNANCREWYAMRPEYHEGNILQLLEAKIDLLKSVKGRGSLSKVKLDNRLYFGVDI